MNNHDFSKIPTYGRKIGDRRAQTAKIRHA